MADVNNKDYKMSDKFISEKSRNEDSSQRGGTGKKIDRDKPIKMQLYRPRQGMALKRSDGESWRAGSAEIRQQNRQVDTNDEQSEITNKMSDLSVANNWSGDANEDNRFQKSDSKGYSKPVTVKTDNLEVVDLTVSPLSGDEKKKSKKPEQLIYVPKAANQEQKSEKISWADTPVYDIAVEEQLIIPKTNPPEKPRSKKKKSRKTAKDRENGLNDSNSLEEPRNVRQGSEPRSMQFNRSRQSGRDTRSMEKPPMMKDLDSLPPRFRKKLLEEKTLQSLSAIGTTSEEKWDGGSVSFSSHAPPQWTQTVPSSRGRGRGRGRGQFTNQNPMDLDRRPSDSRFHDSRYDNASPRYSEPVAERYDNASPRYSEPVAERYDNASPRYSEPVAERYDKGNGSVSYESKNSARSRQFDSSDSIDNRSVGSSVPLQSHRSGGSFSPEPRAVSSAPVIFTNSSTPQKKMDWSEIMENDEMSRSSSQSSLHLHSAPIQSLPRSRDRRGGYRRHDRSHSRDSAAGGNSSSGGGASQRRRDVSRDRNKGHYRFHTAGSRENSRDRKEWRRSSSRETSKDRDWRRSNSRETSRDRSDWRKGNRRDDQQGSWRNASNLGSNESMGPPPVPPMKTVSTGSQAPRGFLHVPNTAQSSGHHKNQQPSQPPRQLFDPNNPARPIMVNAVDSRGPPPAQNIPAKASRSMPVLQQHPAHPPPLMGNMSHISSSDPAMYGPAQKISYYLAIAERNPRLRDTMRDLEAADMDLSGLLMLGYARQIPVDVLWNRIEHARGFLKHMLSVLISTELKFCQTENIEQNIWKVAYYNIIEALKVFMQEDAEKKAFYKKIYLTVLEEGFKYFEDLIEVLEEKNKFKLDDFMSEKGPAEKSSNVALAINAAQKLLLCLGDLSRYREHIEESMNYSRARGYYTRALSLNPKNGRPYYQLGLVSYSSKKKVDAIYYYMRSLMAAHPQMSARESLLSLFEEFRKKYESTSRKKVAEEKAVTEKELKESASLRREIWIHPSAKRRRVHRTTSTSNDSRRLDSDSEELLSMSPAEINRLLTTSYLHVQGKIFSKTGMETFQETALHMLKEFRAFLSLRPLPVMWMRVIQIAALNIFAIEHTKLKDPQLEPGSRSAVQENALIISLEMLSLMLERVLILLKEQLETEIPHIHEDVQCLLPAIKVYCDWLLSHESVWNPPPCCTDFCVGPPVDCWSRLAALVNFLEEYPFWKATIVTKKKQGYEQVRLPEDSYLCGFTPLILQESDEIFTPPDTDMQAAQCCLRFRKVLFFATDFLPGIDPPVLKVQNQGDRLIYVSTVQSPGPSPANPVPEADEDVLFESFSEDEEESDEMSSAKTPEGSSVTEGGCDTQWLLRRKELLERRHQRQERQRRRIQAILADNGKCSEIEVRPRYLVPDTNCFIDHLTKLKTLAAFGSQSADNQFILSVPLTVVTELEGLARGGRDLRHLSLNVQAQSMTVSEDAREALAFLNARSVPSVRCVTPSGKIIKSFKSFAVEDGGEGNAKNDDKILATCLSLCRSSNDETALKPGEHRRVYRDVVLLTEDRNLRVKALSRELPVRELPDFMQWLGLGPG